MPHKLNILNIGNILFDKLMQSQHYTIHTQSTIADIFLKCFFYDQTIIIIVFQ